MLDIRLIRDNPDVVRKGLQDRGGRSLPDFEKVLSADKEWREVLASLDKLRARRNSAADEIGKLKREKQDASALIKEMETVKVQLKELEEKERPLKEQVD